MYEFRVLAAALAFVPALAATLGVQVVLIANAVLLAVVTAVAVAWGHLDNAPTRRRHIPPTE